CPICGVPGHARAVCPTRVCDYCTAKDDHVSRRCPIYTPCERCAQRGHTAAQCTADLAPGEKCCLYCGERGHDDEDCIKTWSKYPERAKRLKEHEKMSRDQLFMSCYRCGGNDHFGDDCV
ncbi:hypothetical protein BDY21DRAFT_273793, partial [Lineolata rhizophorae]